MSADPIQDDVEAEARQGLLDDKLHAEAFERMKHDMTGESFEFHLIRVSAAHGARAASAAYLPLVAAAKEEGIREGKAAVLHWLRERGAMKPPATLWHSAAILADQFEQSEQPGDAIRKEPAHDR